MTDMLDEGLELDALDPDTVTEDNYEHLSLAMGCATPGSVDGVVEWSA